jgi:hypothetical protein
MRIMIFRFCMYFLFCVMRGHLNPNCYAYRRKEISFCGLEICKSCFAFVYVSRCMFWDPRPIYVLGWRLAYEHMLRFTKTQIYVMFLKTNRAIYVKHFGLFVLGTVHDVSVMRWGRSPEKLRPSGLTKSCRWDWTCDKSRRSLLSVTSGGRRRSRLLSSARGLWSQRGMSWAARGQWGGRYEGAPWNNGPEGRKNMSEWNKQKWELT